VADYLVALIGATALEAATPLYTCNARHFPMEGLEVREIKAGRVSPTTDRRKR
jgi:hypothetical protein